MCRRIILQRWRTVEPRRLHELPLFQAERLPPHDARHVEPVDRADGHADQQEGSLEHDHEKDHEEDERHCIQGIDETHHYRVDAATDVTRDRSVKHTDNEADQARDDCNQQRYTHAHHRAHEQVASEFVGAEPVHAGQFRCAQYSIEIRLLVFVRAYPGQNNGEQRGKKQEAAANPHGIVAACSRQDAGRMHSPVAHPGVDHPVEDIDDQVKENDQRCVQNDNTEHERGSRGSARR